MNINSNHEYIRSKDNERVKLFSKLSLPKYRESEKLFLAEGVKLCREALDAGLAEYLLVSEERYEETGVSEIVTGEAGDVQVLVLSAVAFSKVTTESSPQGIIAVCRFPDFHVIGEDANASDFSGKRIIALDGIRDPGNLGTIFRSALAFGVDAVILGDCADLYSSKTVRASMGALFRLHAAVCGDLSIFLSKLKGDGRRIIGAALSENSLTLGEYEKRSDDVVVIGNEGHGLSAEVLGVCDCIVKIPMAEFSESLNAGVAASVIMWEYWKNNR